MLVGICQVGGIGINPKEVKENNMLNDKILNFLNKVLDSSLPPETKNEIVRFYTLPRNTHVRPMVELPEDDIDIGPVTRPTAKDEYRKLHPMETAGDEAVTETLKGRI